MRWSLSWKVAARIGGVLLLMAVGVAALTFSEARKIQIEQKQALTDVLNYTFETLLSQDALPSLQRVVENGASARDVRRIVILDRDGKVLASSDHRAVGKASDSEFARAFLAQERFERVTRETADAVIILQPLRGRGFRGGATGDIEGVAEVVLDRDAVESGARAAALRLLAVSLGSYVALSIALAVLLRSLVTGPVQTLAAAAQRFRGGDRGLRSRIRSDDEIGVLSRAFDDMADEVEAVLRGLEDEVKARTAELRESEARTTRFLEHLPVGVVVFDRAGKLSYANRYAHALVPDGTGTRYFTDRSRYFIAGTRLTYPTAKLALARALAGQEAMVDDLEVEVPDRLIPLQIWGSPVFDERGRVEHVVIAFHDITERRKMEEMKNAFISTVSHELRTPLTAIRGALGLLSGGICGELPEDAREMITISHESCERLVRLVNDILDIEKLSSGRMELRIEPQPMGPLLAQALSANQAYAAGLKVTLSLADEAPEAIVAVDADRLLQVLTNLLSNAAKFSPPGEQVRLVSTRRGPRLRVAIEDRGPGIPEEFKSRIFQRFSQADSSTTRKKDGTGLGLSICKAIVEKHGGTIGFEPGASGGTTFYFELTVVEPAEPSAEAA